MTMPTSSSSASTVVISFTKAALRNTYRSLRFQRVANYVPPRVAILVPMPRPIWAGHRRRSHRFQNSGGHCVRHQAGSRSVGGQRKDRRGALGPETGSPKRTGGGGRLSAITDDRLKNSLLCMVMYFVISIRIRLYC